MKPSSSLSMRGVRSRRRYGYVALDESKLVSSSLYLFGAKLEAASVCNRWRRALCSRYAGRGKEATEDEAAGEGLKIDRELLGFRGLVAGEWRMLDVLGLRKRLGESVGEVPTQETSELRDDEARMILGSYGVFITRAGPRIDVWESD